MNLPDDAFVARACEIAGIPRAKAELIRVGTNVLFRLPTAGLVIRIGLSPDARTAAEKEIRVAHWLDCAGVPAPRPAEGLSQPLVVDGLPVTFWQWLPEEPDPPTAADLGSVLTRLHRVGPGPELEALDPLRPARRDLARATAADPSIVAYLRREVDRLATAFPTPTLTLPPGPVHGDAHTGNLLRSQGRILLIDLETFAAGPREWDLIPTAVRLERFGLSAAEYGSFVDAYGFDIRGWDGYPVLRRIREVVITSWLVPRAGRASTTRELLRRVAALQSRESDVRWRPF